MEPACSHILAPGAARSVGMSADRIEDVFARIQRRVNDGLFPGAAALIARHGVIVGHRAFGTKVAGENDPVTLDTLFDVESMTKVLATAPSVMILADQRLIGLDDAVAEYLPGFAANGKAGVRIRDMLRYASGLPVDDQLLGDQDRDAVWRFMEETPLEYATGTKVEYSDLTYRLLGRLIETVARTDLDTFARHHIWGPLGMTDTLYNPPAALVPRIAATAPGIRGEVEDRQDLALGGIVGCDGVFSTALDVGILCQTLLNGGSYRGVAILPPDAVAQMVSNQTPRVTAAATDLSPLDNLLFTPKGYGFELATHRFSTGGTRLSPRSYGKTGGAGTFMWIDPERRVFGVLLTNHGLPVSFDAPGWNRLVDGTAPGEFFDGIIGAIDEGSPARSSTPPPPRGPASCSAWSAACAGSPRPSRRSRRSHRWCCSGWRLVLKGQP